MDDTKIKLPPLLKKNSSGRLKVNFGINRSNSNRDIKVFPTPTNNTKIPI